MNATTGWIGSIVAGSLLALGLLAAAPVAAAAPADRQFDCEGPSAASEAHKTPDTEDGDHPSGKPGKGLEQNGNSGTQGASNSDPDGDSNGGADKPGCDGGFDAHDRDGNNGCGNDHDFEDDNNGWCGRKPAQEPAVKPVRAEQSPVYADAGTITPSGFATRAPASAPATSVAGQVTVAGADLEAADTETTEVADSEPATEVMGVTVARPDVLAATGLGLGGLAMAGALLLGSGRLTALARRLTGGS